MRVEIIGIQGITNALFEIARVLANIEAELRRQRQYPLGTYDKGRS